MKENEIESVLLDNLVIDNNQGYALYFESPKYNIEKYNGYENINNCNLINENTNFRLASVTKQFIAFGILSLIKDSRIKINTKLSEIFNDLPNYMQGITIKNLLNHTSGLYNYEDMRHYGEQIKDNEILQFLKRQTRTYFEPGIKYQYSNTGYILLGNIIEKVTNTNIEDFIKKEIFDKVSMKNSYVNKQGITKIKNRAYGNILANGILFEKDQGLTTATIGDGGIYSSINDLKKWIEFIITNKYLSNNMFKSNILTDGTNINYGYGVKVIKYKNYKIIYHCGETIGTNTIIGFIPKMKIRFIFLTNLDGVDTDIFLNNLINYLDNKDKDE